MRALLQDLRFALRGLVKTPMFTGVVVVTLALAIGVNTVIFSMASFLLLRPLPFQDPDTIGFVYGVDRQQGTDRGGVSFPDFVDWREASTSFEQLAATVDASHTLTGVRDPTRISARRGSFNLFDIWGFTPVLGRTFTAAEDMPGGAAVVVLSQGFWTRQFGSDPTVVGSVLELDGEPHTIVGVLGPEVEIGGFSEIDVWTPLALDAAQADRGDRTLRVTGRLKPGVTLEEAGAEIAAITRRLQLTYPASNAGWDARVVSIWAGLTGENTWLILTLLTLVVTFVLLIACANVANMTLARGVSRRAEMALRIALGAGRWRLVRERLTESLLLALGGGAVGLAVAFAGLAVIHSIPSEPFFQQIVIDYRVLLFTAALSLLIPFVFGLWPALQSTRTDVNEVLKEGSARTAGGRQARRGRNGLVVAQVALAVTLLLVAGLALRTAVAMRDLDLGFNTDEVTTVRIDLSLPKYPTDEQVRSWYDNLLAELAALPGVEAAAAVSSLPVFESGPSSTITIEGQDLSTSDDQPRATHVVVSPDYDRAMGIAVLQGRTLSSSDRTDGIPVVLINQEMARRYWTGPGEAIGQRIRLGDPSGNPGTVAPWREVVGIMANVGADPVAPPQPQVFVPFGQAPQRSMAVVVRTSVAPESALPAIRDVVRRADADQVVADVQTLARMFSDRLASDRLLIGMFASFAVLALLLAASGLYGVMSYSVSQRSQEIGIRMALGAAPRAVVRLVVLSGLRLAAGGVVIGVAGGLLLGRAISSVLYSVGPADPPTYTTVLLVMTVVALLASYLPARRAMRLDPVSSLRID